jgi:hypothetical protein
MMNIQTPGAIHAARNSRAVVFSSLQQTAITVRLRSAAIFAALMLLLITQTAIAGAEPQSTPAPAIAQNQSSTGNVDKQKTCPSYAEVTSTVTVREVSNFKYKDSKDDLEKRGAGFGDYILIKIEKPEPLVTLSKCQKQDIGLFINGSLIKGLKGEVLSTFEGTKPSSDPNAATVKTTFGLLKYYLQRDAGSDDDQRENDGHWADLLGLSSNVLEWKWYRPIEISVGLAGETPVPTDVTPGNSGVEFKLIRVREYRFWGWLFAFVIGIGFLIWLAEKRDLLRDRAPVIWPQKRPYSLSAVQGAWWFVLIISSFVFIWLVTGGQNFSSTALTLLSISMGTALGATVIDVNKKASGVNDQANPDELNHLLSEKEKLEEELDALKKRMKEAEGFAEKKAEYDKKIEEIKQKFPRAIGPAHEGFLLDILSDASGVSFHRFQMMVWTVVLGVFFITSVLGKMAMPEFDTTLLALMGISAGTFIGFKIPENNNVPTAPKDDASAHPAQEANERAKSLIDPSTQAQGSSATPQQPVRDGAG